MFCSSLNYTIKQLLFAQKPSFRKYEIAQKSLIRVPWWHFLLLERYLTHTFIPSRPRESSMGFCPSLSTPCRGWKCYRMVFILFSVPVWSVCRQSEKRLESGINGIFQNLGNWGWSLACQLALCSSYHPWQAKSRSTFAALTISWPQGACSSLHIFSERLDSQMGIYYPEQCIFFGNVGNSS